MNVPLCASLKRHKFILRYRPKNIGFYAISRVFQPIPYVVDGLPIDAILDCPEVRRDVA